MTTVPFICAKSGDSFLPEQGGQCALCRRLMRSAYLVLNAVEGQRAPLCVDCLEGLSGRMRRIELGMQSKLLMQRALLGNITPEMSSVMVAFTERRLNFRVRFACVIQEEHRMRVSEIETELIADLPDVDVQGVAEPCEFPEKIQLMEGEVLVFGRAPD